MTLFSAAHQEYRAELRRLVEERLLPHADDWERRAELPRSAFEELGRAGVFGKHLPVACGGEGLDFAYNLILAEELPRSRMLGLTLSMMAQAQFFTPLLADLGSEEQKREFLRPAIRGEKIGALAVTEPAGGSDVVRACQTTASDEGDYWLVSGEKKYITNGPIADFIVALVRTRPENATTSFSLLIIPTDTPGFRVRENMRKLGLHTSPTGWLEMDRCRIPKALTVGKPNLGFFYAGTRLIEERLVAAACGVATAGMVLDLTIDFLRHRRIYDRPLSEMQAVRHKIVETAAELEMARRFVYSLAETYRDGKVEAKEICMAKFQVVDVVHRVVERCLQLHGGAGFLEDNWLSRVYRDMRVLSVGGGASEMMKDLVAGYLRL